RRARAAIGLDDVAVHRDLHFAQRLKIDHGAQRAADKALDLERAPALLARGGLAAHAVAGRTRQHAVFGRHPALAGIAQPWRNALWEGCRSQHMRTAELEEERTLRMRGNAAFEGDRPHLVGLAFGWPHGSSGPFRCAGLVAPTGGGRKG